jgi:O-antigen/teichoic acid export membrane protein
VSRFPQLAKDSVIYGFGGVLAKSVSFFLLPVYTRIFEPTDYGTIEMLTVIVGLFSAILGMGMDSAQSFYFFKQKEQGLQEQIRVVSAILQWRLLWGSLIVIVATLGSPLINNAFFEGELDPVYFAIAFCGALFTQVMSQSAEVFRLLYRPWAFISITLGQSLAAATLILYFVLVYDQGIFGFFLGSSTASLALGILGWICIREYVDFKRFHIDWWPRLLKFGAPLLPAGIAMYLMNATDRWFMQHYHGPEALGIYAVGAKFAILTALAVETFRKAWWPIAMDAMHGEDGPETFRTIARFYLGFGAAGVVYLTFLSPWLVSTFAAPAYVSAWPIVGILAWQSLFYGFYMVASGGIWKAEKTWLAPIIMAVAAFLNLGLNFLWVPAYGGKGAALATSITFGVWCILTLFVSQRLWRVPFQFWIMSCQILLGVVLTVWLLISSTGTHSFAITFIAVHAAVLILFLSSADTRLMKRFLGDLVTKWKD